MKELEPTSQTLPKRKFMSDLITPNQRIKGDTSKGHEHGLL